jgi:4-hydroxybenzoate polyprenyltransferase
MSKRPFAEPDLHGEDSPRSPSTDADRIERGAQTARGKLLGAVLVIHPFPVSVVVISSGVLLAIAHGSLPPAGLLARALGAVLMSQIAVGALNDVVDRHGDALSQPNKPIPAGRISLKAARGLVVVGLVGVVLLAASFGASSLFLMLLATGGGLVYDLRLKPTPYAVTCYWIGFLTLITWIWAIAGHLTVQLFALYPAGALLLLAAHLAQSFPDIEKDRLVGRMGLATVLGPKRTRNVVVTAYAAATAGALALSIAAGNLPALALALLACVTGGLAGFQAYREPLDIPVRERFFHLIAPGIGLAAIGSALAFSRL